MRYVRSGSEPSTDAVQASKGGVVGSGCRGPHPKPSPSTNPPFWRVRQKNNLREKITERILVGQTAAFRRFVKGFWLQVCFPRLFATATSLETYQNQPG